MTAILAYAPTVLVILRVLIAVLIVIGAYEAYKIWRDYDR